MFALSRQPLLILFLCTYTNRHIVFHLRFYYYIFTCIFRRLLCRFFLLLLKNAIFFYFLLYFSSSFSNDFVNVLLKKKSNSTRTDIMALTRKYGCLYQSVFWNIEADIQSRFNLYWTNLKSVSENIFGDRSYIPKFSVAPVVYIVTQQN